MKKAKAALPESPRATVFKIKIGKEEFANIEVERLFGFFIKEAMMADNYRDLNEVIGRGLTYKSVIPLMHFLELSNQEIALLTGVSTRTVTRWNENTNIGVLPSKNLVKIDSLVHKGIQVFGSEELFKSWLQESNTALGDVTPLDMLSTPYGVELVEEAIEALEFGNVM